jgi:hypothetical protein
MTEKEQFTAMLTRAGVDWSESSWGVRVDDVPTPGATTVRIKSAPDSDGCYGFYTDFEFSSDGQLLRLEVWE